MHMHNTLTAKLPLLLLEALKAYSVSISKALLYDAL